MKNKIDIKQMVLINFKGIRNLEINFSDETNIYGDNAVGKTTVFDAFTWLIFGKDSEDRTDFNIKTLDSNNNVIPKIEHEVNAVITSGGETIKLRRVLVEKWTKKKGQLIPEYTGNKTDYFWNDVPKSQKEYQDKIASLIDEKVFKLITNPLAFNTNLAWKDRRQVLIDLAGGVTNEDVAKGNEKFEALLAKLTGKDLEEYKKEMASKRTRLNKEIKTIPTRIDEVERGTPAALNFEQLKKDKAVLETKKETIDGQLNDKITAFAAVNTERQQIGQEIHNINGKIQTIEFDTKNTITNSLKKGPSQKDQLTADLTEKTNVLNSLVGAMNSLTAQKETLETSLKAKQNEIIQLRNDWNTENAKELNFDDQHFDCPTCKRAFEPGDIEAKKAELTTSFNEAKQRALTTLNHTGTALVNEETAIKNQITVLDGRVSTGNETIKTQQEAVDAAEKLLKELAPEVETPTQSFEELYNAALKNNVEYQKHFTDLAEKNAKLEGLKTVNTDELNQKKSGLLAEIKVIDDQLLIEDQIAKANKRKAELTASEEKLAQEISEIELEEFTIQNFTKAKVNLIDQRINGKFEFVKFKMFETQVNGAEDECCLTLINGVPFNDANNAAKINAGLDIINALCTYYNITAPVFIDNRESIVKIIDIDSQIINLIVSEPDKTLRIE